MSIPETTPCYGQTADEVEAWLRANVCIGAIVAIKHADPGAKSLSEIRSIFSPKFWKAFAEHHTALVRH